MVYSSIRGNFMQKYRIKPFPLYSTNEMTDVNTELQDKDIEMIFKISYKNGFKRVGFSEAYRLRLEAATKEVLYKIPFIGDFKMSLPEWCQLNGYYLEYLDEEITEIENTCAHA